MKMRLQLLSCRCVETQPPGEAEFARQIPVELVPHVEQYLVGTGRGKRGLVGATLEQRPNTSQMVTTRTGSEISLPPRPCG
jgi:hypothetical protein